MLEQDRPRAALGVLDRSQRFQILLDGNQPLTEHGLQQFVPALEMSIDSGAADPGVAGDRIERCWRRQLAADLTRTRENPLASGYGIGAHSPCACGTTQGCWNVCSLSRCFALASRRFFEVPRSHRCIYIIDRRLE